MNAFEFTLHGTCLTALPSGALWWAEERLICVSDLHLGKAERHARRTGAMIPPYEIRDTLLRLSDDLDRTRASTVICLGDSFDDRAAAEALPEAEKLWITSLQAGRKWIWIEGNHDPGPVDLGGAHLAELALTPLTFRHIARPSEKHELSGHYHPKVTVPTGHRRISRPAFLVDETRVILPAYGTYTGGLRSSDSILQELMRPGALAILTGLNPCPIPMPRAAR